MWQISKVIQKVFKVCAFIRDKIHFEIDALSEGRQGLRYYFSVEIWSVLLQEYGNWLISL